MELTEDKLIKAAFILRTIAHPTRLSVIHLLQANDRLSVNELVTLTGCEQSLLSHHLNNMKLKGLLAAERSGTNKYYSLKERNLVQVLNCIGNCDCQMG